MAYPSRPYSQYNLNASAPGWRDHVCGLYYSIPNAGQLEKLYLPQVNLQAHTNILSTTSRTVLTQTFANPSDTKGIKEVRYTFPLYDGVSVVGFTCHVGDRTIVGEVKEKEKARAVFQEAVARGETAGLFEQLPDASDVFTTTVGNVPPGAKVIVKITYLGELKHDMEVDGIRFTIPTIICPRYGKYPLGLTDNTATTAIGSGISITVDAEMSEGSFIQQIRSPSHPIAINMGTTSFAPNADPTMTKASASLSLGSAQLDTDFILQIVAKDTGVPRAIVETHPTIPHHRALMATLVPKFVLPSEKPEVVFVCDQSGSMSGSRTELVKQALRVFLKSLPVGVKFNICVFGSRYSFLWPKSVTYSQQTLDQAVQHVETFNANYGGTEMLQPMKGTISQRYLDIPLEIMMLTDGEIWDQTALFDYLNQQVHESKAPIRVFSLGIGNGVSHALIEGIAKAGNGFSQSVGEGEKMDSKVVRMLKGALSPHITDYTLEVKYAEKRSSRLNEESDDDFEILEKVADSLSVKLGLEDEIAGEREPPVRFQSKAMSTFFADYAQKKTISLFDTSVDPDKEEPAAQDESGEARYSHLPKLATPKIIQAPQSVPPLFAFNRTTVYLLLGPDAPRMVPKSVVLRGTSEHGPLELEIPVQVLDNPGETIHQLAAKKAIAELEQGRGWLQDAKDGDSGQSVRTKYPSRFDDMVEREAVRLGVQFQVGGKWCSFVAVEKAPKKEKEQETYEWLDVSSGPTEISQSDSQSQHPGKAAPNRKRFMDLMGPAFKPTPAPQTQQTSFQPHVLQPTSHSLRSSACLERSSPAPLHYPQYLSSGTPTLVGRAVLTTEPQVSPVSQQLQDKTFGGVPPQPTHQPSQGNHALQDYQMGLMTLEQQNKKRLLMQKQATPSFGHTTAQFFGPQSSATPFGQIPASGTASSGLFGSANTNTNTARSSSLASAGHGTYTSFSIGSSAPGPFSFGSAPSQTSPPTARASTPIPQSDDELLKAVIALQTFEGYWDLTTKLCVLLSASEDQANELAHEISGKVVGTALVIAYLEGRLQGMKGSWELVVEKARGWLEGMGEGYLEGAALSVEELVKKAGGMIRS